jgi:hypothetical protein
MHETDESLRWRIRAHFVRQVEALTECEEFRGLEDGRAARAEYDAFIENVARAHLASPQLLAFLYALAPPVAADALGRNMLEELGLDDERGTPHPALLEVLVRGAGLESRLPRLRTDALEDLRRIIVDPLLYGTLRDVGLAAMTEIVAFEFMLSRVSGRIARALAHHRGLPPSALEWFTHHSEVDIRHAEEGLDSLDAYISYYEIAPADALLIVEMTLRENVFARRYFRARVPAAASGRSAR